MISKNCKDLCRQGLILQGPGISFYLAWIADQGPLPFSPVYNPAYVVSVMAPYIVEASRRNHSSLALRMVDWAANRIPRDSVDPSNSPMPYAWLTIIGVRTSWMPFSGLFFSLIEAQALEAIKRNSYANIPLPGQKPSDCDESRIRSILQLLQPEHRFATLYQLYKDQYYLRPSIIWTLKDQILLAWDRPSMFQVRVYTCFLAASFTYLDVCSGGLQ